jgi:hypothetical protein
MRAASCLALLLWAAPALAEDVPAPFTALLADLAGSGFHVNSRLTDGGLPGYEIAAPCPPFDERGAPVCAQLKGSWRSSLVADTKIGGQAVVQELWALAYESSAAAAAAAAAMNDMTFGKHPFVLFSSGRFLYVIEGRFRFHTPRTQLARAVAKRLRKTAPKLVEPALTAPGR